MRVYLSEAFRALGLTFSAPRPGDAGYDLFAIEAVTLAPGAQAAIRTGVHVELPPGTVGIIKDRSSMALRGVHTYGGVIDSGYRGEIKVILNNLSQTEQPISVGQKFAQMVIVAYHAEPVEVTDTLDALSSTERGAGGFGSTGG
jgi:dUTP pyrophosphatase